MPENLESKPMDTYDVVREADRVTLMINLENFAYTPSIEDDPICMSRTIEKLAEIKGVSNIIFVQKRDYEYDYNQTRLLVEIAQIYKEISKMPEIRGYYALGGNSVCTKCLPTWHAEINELVIRMLKRDPFGAYVELRRVYRREKIKKEHPIDPKCIPCEEKYMEILNKVILMLDKTKLVLMAKPYLAGYKPGDREVYRRIFSPTIKPDFMFTKLMASYPSEGEELSSYSVGETDITIFGFEDSVKYLYHMVPPEFKLEEDEYEILDLARRIMAEHKPKKSEFVDPKRMREVFYNVGRDLIEELVDYKKMTVRSKQLDLLTDILVRYTVGFGLIEVLLQDEKIQDVSINSPLGLVPMFIVHGDFDDCTTNVIPTRQEAESWASKLRMISGRPLDEANQILDTEIELPGATARVSAITAPLDPTGLAFSFRRHRDKPWTLPLFMKYKMINSMGAGLLSFFIDGTRTMLIAGTRSSGKSSFLTAVIVEIMRRYRILTIEDTLELPSEALRKLGYNIQQMLVAGAFARKGSAEMPAEDGIRSTLRLGDSSLIVGEVRSSLRGDQEVVIIENNITKRVAIKDLENKDLTNLYVPTMTDENKSELKKLTGFVKHPKRSKLIKLTTKTGRTVIVTPDHSVFTHINFKIAAINTDQLKEGDPIIIPSKIPNNFNDIDSINLLEILKEDYRLENAEPYLRKAIKSIGWRKASKICGVPDIYRYLLSTQKTRVPITSFLKLMQEAKIEYDITDLRIKKGTSNSIPAKFPINENIMRLIGYYLAEGNIDATKIQITNSKPKIIEDIRNICEKELGLKTSSREIRGYGKSVQTYIISKPLMDLLAHFGCGKTSYNKRIPEFAFGLSKRKICALLKGMYSGDGSIASTKNAGNMVRYFSTSKKLTEDVSYALLSLGIVCRLHQRPSNKKGKKDIFVAEIKQRKFVEQFLKEIGFTHKKSEIIKKSFAHSEDDSVSFEAAELERHIHIPRKYRHLRKTKCCSKDYLKRITEEIKCSHELYEFSHGDFFIDKVKSIEIINLKKPEYVYDLSVKSTQRFIGGFGGIILHNTEAKSLYEAMRVGAAANVVAGTIHADSPYGLYDRLVNDIGVPKTSFKATDICVIANPVRSASSLQKLRRVIQITEVGKDWDDDPQKEGAFVDLMKYDPNSDQLEISDKLRNGESTMLKAIAANIKEFAGNWDALWENIELRAKVKQTLVDYATKAKDLELLEAPFVIRCNDRFHKLQESITREVGHPDPQRIYFEWDNWIKREIKKFQLKDESEEGV